MRIHRRIRRRRFAAAVLVSLVAAFGGPAAALAASGEQYPRPVPPTHGVTPSDFVKPAPRVGDTPADFPGASRAQTTPPTAITVVRPERTIVRGSDSVLPLILASLALLVALGIAGTALAHQRSVRPGRAA